MKHNSVAEFARRISKESDGAGHAELVPAATVILLRDSEQGLQTLMLRKNSKIAFGGMWVFPGGRIDAEDGSPDDEMEQRARVAAVREAREETSLVIDPSDLTWISHWTPPPMGNRRFSTWFFATPAPAGEVEIDEGEIIESRWLTGAEALAQQAAGDIELAPPTYVTLSLLAKYASVDSAMEALVPLEPRYYQTRIAKSEDGLVALWAGDAGYESGDADTPGARHRLSMRAAGFELDESGVPPLG